MKKNLLIMLHNLYETIRERITIPVCFILCMFCGQVEQFATGDKQFLSVMFGTIDWPLVSLSGQTACDEHSGVFHRPTICSDVQKYTQNFDDLKMPVGGAC
jgi:hypothetical protein